jgi:hypothetical protein
MMARFVARFVVACGAIALLSCCSIRTEELHRMAVNECPELIAAADAADLNTMQSLTASDLDLVAWCKLEMKKEHEQ